LLKNEQAKRKFTSASNEEGNPQLILQIGIIIPRGHCENFNPIPSKTQTK
jgi:hypothetical protein